MPKKIIIVLIGLVLLSGCYNPEPEYVPITPIEEKEILEELQEEQSKEWWEENEGCNKLERLPIQERHYLFKNITVDNKTIILEDLDLDKWHIYNVSNEIEKRTKGIVSLQMYTGQGDLIYNYYDEGINMTFYLPPN